MTKSQTVSGWITFAKQSHLEHKITLKSRTVNGVGSTQTQTHSTQKKLDEPDLSMSLFKVGPKNQIQIKYEPTLGLIRFKSDISPTH